jgi:eukaryotic-like serine/threonine-protein kinase
MAPVTTLSAGETFAARYAVQDVLGEGGMGAVYRVLDRELDETIALKLLRAEWADSAGALDRFRREVKLARRVTHANVARTYDLGFYDGVRFLTMELISGEPLSRRVGNGKRLQLGEALRIAGEVARGLAAAHTAGVVHRDLKPDNIMLGEDDRVVITDFGIARLAEGAVAGNATRTMGSAIGTPAYMAPEQVEGRELDGRADIYALGIVLYEMLTGELPFVGDTVYAMAAARLAGVFPDPRTKVDDLPDGVAVLLKDALARKREDRPDAQAFLRRLDELRGVRIERVEPTIAAPVSTPITSSAVLSNAGPRTIAVLPPEGTPTPAAIDLLVAIADALSALRGIKVLPPNTVTVLAKAKPGDAATVGRVLSADVVLEGSVRTAGGKMRVRVRAVEVSSGTQLWSERWEGSADDPFALEDDVVRGTIEALRARLLDEARRGPADPDAREAYRTARKLYAAFGSERVAEAIEILRKAHASWPGDPWIMSALGAALARAWILQGGGSNQWIAEAEELSLRALAIDSSIGETYNTIGILRLQQGEMRLAVRGFQEAIARSPLLAEAHEYLGRLLCECGHPEEGMRRLDLSVRLEPSSVAAHWERARTFALMGDRERAEGALERSIQSAGVGTAQITQRARLALWWGDGAMASRIADDIERTDTLMPALKQNMLPLLRAAAKGQPIAEQVHFFKLIAESLSGSPRQRAFFHQLAVEFYGAANLQAEALEALERAVEYPLLDILWLDRCPVLEPLREHASFGRSRAIVAARAAEAFS